MSSFIATVGALIVITAVLWGILSILGVSHDAALVGALICAYLHIGFGKVVDK